MKMHGLYLIAWAGLLTGAGFRLDAAPIASLASPVVASTATEVKALSFTQGHAVYTLNGKVTTFSLNGTSCGFYFQGDGTFKYTSVNSMEFPAAAFNLKRNCFVKPETRADSMTMGDAIEEGIFFFSPSTMPTISGASSAADGKAFRKQWDFFREAEDSPYLHKLALRFNHSTELAYFHAQVQTRTRPWAHTVDAMDSETLDVLHPRQGDWGIARPWARISRQPIGWDIRKPKGPRFVLTDVDLELVAGEGVSACMKVKETYVPLEDGLKALDLVLASKVIGTSVSGADRTQHVQVKSVKDAQGQDLAFEHSDNGVLVEVPGLKAQTPVSLTFEVEGEMLFKNPEWKYWLLGSWAWFPRPEALCGQAYTMHAIAKVPAPIVPIMGGTTIRRAKEGDFNVLETRFDQPVQFFSLMAGKFELKEETVAGITYRLAVYSGISHGADELLKKLVPNLVSYYQGILGPFPFKELTLVDTPRTAGGRVIPGMISLSTHAHQLADGIASQYWGQQVKIWSPEDAWINAGFSEYSALLATMNMKNKGKSEYENTVNVWFENAKKATSAAPIPLALDLALGDSFSSESFYPGYLLFCKSSCLLYDIHKDLGDDNFVRFMRSYLKTMSWHHSTTAHVPMVIKALTGKDYTKYFEDYYYGTAMPPYRK